MTLPVGVLVTGVGLLPHSKSPTPCTRTRPVPAFADYATTKQKWMREPPEAFNADAAVQANAPGTTRRNEKEELLKTAIANIWQKPWGKVFFAAIYSAASVLLYFALAEIAYGLWGSTIIPSIGQAPVQVETKPIDPAEMQRLWQYTPYTGPGSPQYQPPASGTSH